MTADVKKASCNHLLTLPELIQTRQFGKARQHIEESGLLIPDAVRAKVLKVIAAEGNARKAPPHKVAFLLSRVRHQLERSVKQIEMCKQECFPFIRYASVPFETRQALESVPWQRVLSDRTPFIVQIALDLVNLLCVINPMQKEESLDLALTKWPLMYSDFLAAYNRFCQNCDWTNLSMNPDMRVARDEMLRLMEKYLKSENRDFQKAALEMQNMLKVTNVNLFTLPLHCLMSDDRPAGEASSTLYWEKSMIEILPGLQEKFILVIAFEGLKQRESEQVFPFSQDNITKIVEWFGKQLLDSQLDQETFCPMFMKQFGAVLCEYHLASFELPDFIRNIYTFNPSEGVFDEEDLSLEDLECNFNAMADAFDYYIDYLTKYKETSDFINAMFLVATSGDHLRELARSWQEHQKAQGANLGQLKQFLRREVPILTSQIQKSPACSMRILEMMKQDAFVGGLFKRIKIDRDFATKMIDVAYGCFSLPLSVCHENIESPEWQSAKKGPARASSVRHKEERKGEEEAPSSATAPVVVHRPPAPAIGPLAFIENALLSPLNPFKAKFKKDAKASVDNATLNIQNVVLLMNRLLQDVRSPERHPRVFQTIASLIGEAGYAMEQLLLAVDLQRNPPKDRAELLDRQSHSFFELFRKSYKQLQFFNADDRQFIYYQLNRAEIAIRSLDSNHGPRHVATQLFAPALQFSQQGVPINDLIDKTEAFLDQFLKVIYKFTEPAAFDEYGEQLQIYFGRLRDATNTNGPAPIVTPFAAKAKALAEGIQKRVLELPAEGSSSTIVHNLLLRLRTELSRHGEARSAEAPLFVSQVIQDIYLIAEEAIDGLCSITEKGKDISRHDFIARLRANGIEHFPPPLYAFIADGQSARNIARYWFQYQDQKGTVHSLMQEAMAIAKQPGQNLFVSVPDGFKLKMSDAQKRFIKIEEKIIEQLVQLEQLINILGKR